MAGHATLVTGLVAVALPLDQAFLLANIDCQLYPADGQIPLEAKNTRAFCDEAPLSK